MSKHSTNEVKHGSLKDKIKNYAQLHSWLQISDSQYITPAGKIVTIQQTPVCPEGEINTVVRIACPE